MFPEFVLCLVEFCKNCKFAKTRYLFLCILLLQQFNSSLFSLQSIELLKLTIQKVGEIDKTESADLQKNVSHKSVDNLYNVLQGNVTSPHANGGTVAQTHHEMAATNHSEDPSVRYWLPVLYALHEIIMNCELEVRTR